MKLRFGWTPHSKKASNGTTYLHGHKTSYESWLTWQPIAGSSGLLKKPIGSKRDWKTKMTPQQSRKLKVNDRVGFLDLKNSPDGPPIDYGTVLANNIHAVQIQWDDVEASGCANGIGWIDHNGTACLTTKG